MCLVYTKKFGCIFIAYKDDWLRFATLMRSPMRNMME
jgi:hypothetical protein